MTNIRNNLYTLKIQDAVSFYLDNIVSQLWTQTSLLMTLEEIFNNLNEQLQMPLFEVKLNNTDTNQRNFSYYINFHSKSLIYKYFHGLNLTVNIDGSNKLVTGGISLDYSFKNNTDINYIIQEIYLKTLMRNFISKQFYPLNLRNLIDVISEYHFCETKNKYKNFTTKKPVEVNKSQIDFKNISVDDINNNWNSILNRKFLFFNYFTDKEAQAYKEDNLFANLFVYSLIVIIVNFLKREFRNKIKPFKPVSFDDCESVSFQSLFYRLTKIIQSNFNGNDQKYLYNISRPLPIYTLYSDNEEIKYYDENFFLQDENMKMIYFLCMTPEVFGMDVNSSHFIEFSQLKNIIFKSKYGRKKLSEAFEEQVDFYTCEESYNFRTFINNEANVLIFSFKENDLFDEYFKSQIYLNARNQIYLDTNHNVNLDNSSEVKTTDKFWKQKQQIMENLLFSEYDDYLLVSDLKDVVFQFERVVNYKKSWQTLLNQILAKQNAFKKGYEHKVLSFALIVAAIIGFINFFAMIFTVLAIGKNGGNLNTTNIIIISITTILAFVLFGVATYFFIRIIRNKIKLKKQEKQNVIV